MSVVASEISNTELADYLQIDSPSPSELSQLTDLKAIAIAFIKSYTGLSAAEVDTYPDISIAVKVLVQDMYDNRAYYIESGSAGDNTNKVVTAILDLHRQNFLPPEELDDDGEPES